MSIVCVLCGGKLVEGEREIEMSYKGLRKVIKMRGKYCEVCGEGIHSYKELEVSDAALSEMRLSVI